MTIQLSQPYSFCQLGKRENQEDSRYPRSNKPVDYRPFFIVCDGVGGSDDGDVASRAVSEGLASYLEQIDWTRTFTDDHLGKALGAAYKALDDASQHASNDMGTTMAMACFHGGGCMIAHIGDSRIYHIRPKVGILYRSDDHSTVNQLVHAGLLSPQRTSTHHTRHMIERCMTPAAAGEGRCEATCYATNDVKAGDYFFLCTDGVLEVIDDNSLTDILCGSGSDADKCQKIARLCNRCQDNNTAYMVRVSAVEKTNRDAEGKPVSVSYSDGATTRRSESKQSATVEVGVIEEGIGNRITRFFKQFI